MSLTPALGVKQDKYIIPILQAGKLTKHLLTSYSGPQAFLYVSVVDRGQRLQIAVGEKVWVMGVEVLDPKLSLEANPPPLTQICRCPTFNIIPVKLCKMRVVGNYLS